MFFVNKIFFLFKNSFIVLSRKPTAFASSSFVIICRGSLCDDRSIVTMGAVRVCCTHSGSPSWRPAWGRIQQKVLQALFIHFDFISLHCDSSLVTIGEVRLVNTYTMFFYNTITIIHISVLISNYKSIKCYCSPRSAYIVSFP